MHKNGKTFLPLLLASLMLVGSSSNGAAAASAPCVSCLSIRLGRPLVVRGPVGDELDTAFTILRKSDGNFRGFSSNSSAYATDSEVPFSFGGSRMEVMKPGPEGSVNQCGNWINALFSGADKLFGLVHNERDCHYQNGGQTHKSMALYSSQDEGLAWAAQGTVISGRDSPTPGKITGEGDCTWVPGNDEYLYAYCVRNSDNQTIVARAPVDNLQPGQWKKYYQGSWSQPGLGGNADALGAWGPSSAVLKGLAPASLLSPDPWFGGLKLSLSNDMVNFTAVNEPLLNFESQNWNRPDPTDLYAYPVFNAEDGSRTLTPSHFYLFYVYVAPNTGFDQRYLVTQDVWMQMKDTPQTPQVGLALNRWVKAATGIRQVTTAPVVGNYTSSNFDKTLGFVMTKAPEGKDSTKLEECSSSWTGHEEFMLGPDGNCAKSGVTRLRSLGWVYNSQQPGTVPLYRCWDPNAQYHFASNQEDCEGLGKMEFKLGYLLEK